MTTFLASTRATTAALLVAAAIALPARAPAQTATAAGDWSAMLGCWQPLAPGEARGDPWMAAPGGSARTLCVLPTDRESAAELVTLAGDSVVARDTVDVAAGTRSRERDGCQGTAGAAWSADGARLYTRTHYLCARGIAQSSSGVLAISTDEQLLDIEQTVRGNAKAVRVSRYARIGDPARLPRGFAARLGDAELRFGAARGGAAAPLTVAAIADASRQLEPEVVEALLLEHGDHMVVDAKRLAALADAGVPGRITDLLVALGYPARFALSARPRAGIDGRVAANDRVPRALIIPSIPDYSLYGPLGYGLYGSPYLYSPYGYSPYGYGGYAYGYYQRPIVVVRNEPPRPHGRVVNGRGYADGSDTGTGTGGTAQPRPSSGSGGSSGSSSSGSSGSSGSSSSGSSSGGGTRTAKPRP